MLILTVSNSSISWQIKNNLIEVNGFKLARGRIWSTKPSSALLPATAAELSSLLFRLPSTSKNEDVAKTKCWLLRGLVYIAGCTTRS